MVPVTSHNLPGVYGFSSEVRSRRTSVPDGPHSWTGDMVRKCGKCGMRVLVGTDGEDALVRLAGRLCSDVLAMEIMNS